MKIIITNEYCSSQRNLSTRIFPVFIVTVQKTGKHLVIHCKPNQINAVHSKYDTKRCENEESRE